MCVAPSDRLAGAGNDNDPTNAAANITDAGIEFDRLDDAELNIVNPRTGDIRAVTIDGNDLFEVELGV